MIKIENLSRVYRTSEIETLALENINFEVKEGEFVAIMGPSGCGKSTLLNILGLLDNPTSGSYRLMGKEVAQLKEKDRTRFRKGKIGFVFQSFNLIDELNVKENVELPLTYMSGISAKERGRMADEILARMNLSHRSRHFPLQLSGGQQQRVAIARALVKMPRVLLLDEPLSNLDARLRLQTREEIKRIQRETGITTVFVTHDQEEAMSISDYIVVMKLGVVQQIGQPQEVYDNPTNLFVAKFLGTPPINVFQGKVVGEKLYINDDAVLDVKGVENQNVTIGIRPEGFIYDPNGPLRCQLRNVEVMGRDVSIVSSNVASVNPIVRSIVDADNVVGISQETVRFSLKPHKVFIFNDSTEERIYFELPVKKEQSVVEEKPEPDKKVADKKTSAAKKTPAKKSAAKQSK